MGYTQEPRPVVKKQSVPPNGGNRRIVQPHAPVIPHPQPKKGNRKNPYAS